MLGIPSRERELYTIIIRILGLCYRSNPILIGQGDNWYRYTELKRMMQRKTREIVMDL